jgi:hypothetical protein
MELFIMKVCLLCGAGDYPPNVLQPTETYCRARFKSDGAQMRVGGGLKGKQANGVGTQLMKRKRQVRASQRYYQQ